MTDRNVELNDCLGNVIHIPLSFDGERQSGELTIDGMLYHFERIHKSVLGTEYIVDRDPDYDPKADPDGYCYIIAPYSK